MSKKESREHKTDVHHKTRKHGVKISHKSLEEQTLQSLIELQKVHINMAEKFDKLAIHIENLLGLFELAARNFAKQPHMQSTERDKEFLEKIDKLLEQNKLLAKGLSLMEENMRERLYGISPSNTLITRPSNFGSQSTMVHSSNTQVKEI